MSEESQLPDDVANGPEASAPAADRTPEEPVSDGASQVNSPGSAEPIDAGESPSASESTSGRPAGEPAKTARGGPISLDRIRQLRQSQQTASSRAKSTPSSTAKDASSADAASTKPAQKPRPGGRKPSPDLEEGIIKTPEPPGVAPKVTVPSLRSPLSQELEDELEAAMAGGDLDDLLIGGDMVQVGHLLDEGQRIQGKVVKSQGEFVFLSLGGPHEGLVPVTQFDELPEPGTQVEVVVRGFLQDEGLYELTMPGNAIQVSDWSDLNEGEVIEVLITGSNAGGLECKAGSVNGFIPASQAAEYRVENLADMVDQKVLCVITEANPRRGNLVLSRRAVLERERREKREERLSSINVGDAVDGTVTKLMDFGAFVDIGGLDGLLHISQLSWERVEHPSELLEVGQKIQVRIDKIDPQSGKIGLSYRSLQEHPWANIDQRFPVGSIVHGSVTRIAEFGAFVRVATGVEGLVHVSELAHHRVHRVSNVVQEGQEVDVKVLSIDEESQRMSLSLKAAQAAPEPTEADQAAPEPPPAKPVLPKHQGTLKGGTSGGGGGEQFGLKW